MSWITVIWTISATICLTFAGLYVTVWFRQRDAWENLLFAVAAVAAAVFAMLEVNLMHAKTPEAYGELLRWMHVPAAILAVAMVWFIHFYLNSGRRWLAWTITGLRMLILVPNFLNYPNATFAEITGLRTAVFLGETFSIPVGEENPWRILIQVSMLLLLLFVLDAAVTTWKQGHRRRALMLGGMTIFAILLAATFSNLMTRGVLPGAFVSFAFLLIVLAMAFELILDLMRSRELARDLCESQQRMSLAARAANLEMWEWDVVRDEVWATRMASEETGIDGSERVKLDRYLEMIHPDDQERIREAVYHVLENGGDLQAEFRIVSPGGDIRWISVYGQVEYGTNGKPLHIRGISRDVTESKYAEAELQERRNELAHISRVSSLGQLSSALAHEINQPLGAILRNTEAAEIFLKQTPTDLDELNDIIKDIRMDTQRATSVIKRMRSLLKRHELQFEVLAVDELISQVSHLLNSELQARCVELLVEVPHELPPVYGDRIQLQQVIINLLLNSLDALEESTGKRRKVHIQASKHQDGMVHIVLSDNGPGIQPEQLPHLFEPFFTTREEGTGIGLAISKTIIESHDGRIMADNNSQGGATFEIALNTFLQEHEQA